MEEEKTLFDYWLVLYRNRFVIFFTVILSMAIAYFLSKRLPKVYEAKTVFFIPSNSDNSSLSFYYPNPKSISRTLVLPPSQEEFFAPFFGILKSRTLAEMVRKEFPQKSLGALLRRDVDFQLNNAYMIELYVRDRDPKLAAEIANAYVRNLNKLLSYYSCLYTEQYISTLKLELRRTKKRLQAVYNKLKKFKETYGISNLDEEVKQLISLKIDFQRKLKESEVEFKKTKEEIKNTKIQLLKEAKLYTPSSLAVESPLLEELKKKLCDLESKMASLRVEYREKHPEFQRTNKEYEKTKELLKKEINRIIKSKIKPSSFYEELREKLINLYVTNSCLKAKIFAYKKILTDIKKKLIKFSSLEFEQSKLKLEANILQNSIVSLENSLNEAQAQKERKMLQVIVVDKAVPPTAPVFPICWLNTLVAGICGLIAGIFYAFFVDYVKRKYEERTVRLLDLIKVEKYIK